MRIRGWVSVWLAASLAAVSVSATAATVVIEERAIARVRVGDQPGQGEPVWRVLTLALTRDAAMRLPSGADSCLRQKVFDLAQQFRLRRRADARDEQLASLTPWQPVASIYGAMNMQAGNLLAERDRAKAAYVEAIRARYAAVLDGFGSRGLACTSKDKKLSFAFAIRECRASIEACRKVEADFAGTARTLGEAPIDFDAPFAWLNHAEPLVVDALYAMSENAVSPVRIPDVRGSPVWNTPLLPEEQLRSFERMVERMRRTKQSMESWSVPTLLGLSKEMVVPIQDVLSEPVSAVEGLRIPTAALAYQAISDELARTRITECSRLRASFTLTDISACSGYVVKDSAELLRCLHGARCLPEVSDKALAAMLEISATRSVKELLTEAQWPRVANGIANLSEYEARASACHDQAKATRGAQARDVAFAGCLIGGDADRINQLLACSRAGGAIDTLACLPELGGGREREVIECLGRGATPETAARCLATEVLPVPSGLDCYATAAISKRGESGMQECAKASMAEILGSDAAAAAACMESDQPEACMEQLLVSGIGDPKAKLLVECGRTSPKREALALCLAPALVEGDVAKWAGVVASCQAGASSGKTVTGCVATAIAGELGDARTAAMVGCAADAASKEAFAMCAGNVLLQDVRDPKLRCALMSGGNWTTAALCAAGTSSGVGGDVGRALDCMMQAGGANASSMICAFDVELNHEQQIALQCVSTAPDPSTAAICVVGQLAMKEFNQCLDKRVGEGNCFGENNEFRKAVRALGLPDIGPNSVAAQMMDIQVEFYRQQYYLGKKAIAEIGRLPGNVAKAGQDIAEAAKDIAEAAQKVGREVERVANQVADAAEQAVEDFGDFLDDLNPF